MRKQLNCLTSIITAFSTIFTLCMPLNAWAETSQGSIASKTAELLNRSENRYEVKVSVPGEDGENKHDEVIMMVDGSYSLDKEWPHMKTTIIEIAKSVLNGKGNTQLTLMAFGMADNIVISHVKDAETISSFLENLPLPGNLLYGRSSTNCEAGYTGVEEYINEHGDTLNKAEVIFISDGGINTDETPCNFYNWKDRTWSSTSLENVAKNALNDECKMILNYGKNKSQAYKAVFEKDGEETDPQTIIDSLKDITYEEASTWAEAVWADVYEFSSLDPNEEYPVSTVERAFVRYDKENNTYIQNEFYRGLGGRSDKNDYSNMYTRTPKAADKLAANKKVEHLYNVRYNSDSRAYWMEKEDNYNDDFVKITAENATYVHSTNISGLVEALKGTITNLSKTPYNDVVITDYMSKWVNLDQDSIKIVDNVTGETIYSAKEDGWLIDENRPTAQEVPVVVEKVDAADYVNGGADVDGNTNGDIYKLTWYVKDGALLRSENYSLVYEVTVDVAEEGFVYETDYPANGNTDMNYIDENGEEKKEKIKIPNVKAFIPNIVKFNKGEASHICYLRIDKNGKVEYLSKTDFKDKDVFAPIKKEDGYISAVFIKQAQSGMIWTSQKVSDEVIDNIIASVKANNKAYKGHDEEAFGIGEHELTYKVNSKKYKTVTYTFTYNE